MSFFVDINVWVAAFRSDHPHHALARAWVIKTLSSREPLQVTVHVLAAFVRLVTNARVMTPVATTDEALGFVHWMISQPMVRWYESRAEWDTFSAMLKSKNLVANAIPDAHLAAITLHSGSVFVTFDKDFKKLLPSKSLLLLKA